MARARKFKLPKSKCKQKLAPLAKADKRSIRWIKRGSTFLLVACPKGKFNAKTSRCKVGTFALEKVKAARGKACPTGYAKR